MPPTTNHLYPTAWHAAQDAQEQAWLNDWMRGRICTITLEVCPALQPAPVVPDTLTTGSH